MTSGSRTALAALLLAPALGLLAVPATADDAGIQTTNANSFSPASVTVDPGDTVTWTNNGGLNHTVTASTENWAKNNSISFNGQSTSYQFEDPGTYGFYCQTHGSPSSGMRGTVVVRAPAASPSASPTRSATPKATPKASASPSRSPSASPSKSASAKPSATPSRAATLEPTAQVPTLLTQPTEPPLTLEPPSLQLGFGGLTGPKPTHRERGLPIALAIIAILGVGSAELRLLMSVPTSED